MTMALSILHNIIKDKFKETMNPISILEAPLILQLKVNLKPLNSKKVSL